MKWFKHEASAHNDAKLEKLLMRYGADGYGLYWYCIELIAGKVSAENITFELEHDAEILGYRLKIDSIRVEEIMRFMIQLGLFQKSGNTITCIRLAKSLDERWTRSQELKAVIRQSSDCLKTDYKPLPLEEKRREEKRKEILQGKIPDRNSCPVQQIVDLYHEKLPELPRCMKITPGRRGNIQARWREDLPTLDEWGQYFDYVRKSKFLMGKAGSLNGRKPFVASLDWLVKPENLAKVAEDKYH